MQLSVRFPTRFVRLAYNWLFTFVRHYLGVFRLVELTALVVTQTDSCFTEPEARSLSRSPARPPESSPPPVRPSRPAPPLQRPPRRGRVKRARSARRGRESCHGLRECTVTVSRNLAGAAPRPAVAGKAADDDDGGVIYGHNRGSGEKEKEGAEYGGRILVRLGTHADAAAR